MNRVITVLTSDSFELKFSDFDISRSELLSDMYAQDEFHFHLPFCREEVTSWMKFTTCEDLDTSACLTVLEVADWLQDLDALDAAVQHLSTHLFSFTLHGSEASDETTTLDDSGPVDSNPDSVHRDWNCGKDWNCVSFRPTGEEAAEALLALPQHLALLVLYACDVDTLDLLSVLPPTIHSLALTSCLTNDGTQDQLELTLTDPKPLPELTAALVSQPSSVLVKLYEVTPEVLAATPLELAPFLASIDGRSFHRIPATLPRLSLCVNLTSLILAWGVLENQHMIYLAAGLQHLALLEVLSLAHNRIGRSGFKVLAPALQSLEFLSSLDLSFNPVSRADTAADTAVGPDAAALVLMSLAPLSVLTNLQTLKLKSVGLCEQCLAGFAGWIPQLEDITELDISENPLPAESMHSLAPQMEALGALESLDLHSCNISAGAARAFARSITTLQWMSMTRLSLQCNPLTVAGVKHLARALPALPALEALDLSRCKVGASGARALAKTLPTLPSLKSVRLGRNELGGKGVRALLSSDAASKFGALEEFAIYENDITPSECAAICPAIASLPSLKILIISNDMKTQGYLARAPALLALQHLWEDYDYEYAADSEYSYELTPQA